MKKRARLKDIAEALNLSVTTVSRALNDKSDISAATKKAVLQVAEMLDYRPNYFAKYLMGDNNNILGVIVPRVAHSFFSDMVDGILHTAQENGYFVLIGESMDKAKNEKEILDKFIDLNVQGILLASAHKSNLLVTNSISRYDNNKIVLMDRQSQFNSLSQVTNNHGEGARVATNHLHEQGYKRIAHISGVDGDIISDAIRNGYINTIKSHNQEPLVYACDNVTPEQGYIAAKYLLQLPEPPDAIFATSDEAAMGVYRYCYEHKISIPNDLGIIGYSDAHKSKYLTPSLSSVSQHSFHMGAYATNIIISESASTQAEIKVFNPSLVIRESTSRTSI